VEFDGIAFEDGRYTVPAALLAARFGLDEATLRAEMRAGRIVSLVERGEGADAGRVRLSFRRGAAAFALVVEPDGRVQEAAPRAPEPALFRMIELARSGRPEG
jgi:hypothetical protein